MTDDFVKTIRKRHAIVLIQERGALPPGNRNGHLIVADATHDRTPAIVVHRALTSKLIESFAGPHFASVVLRRAEDKKLCVYISVYLPDTWKGWELFHDALMNLDLNLQGLQRRLGRFAHILLGDDLNTQTASDGISIGPAVSGSGVSDRASALLVFSCKWDLAHALGQADLLDSRGQKNKEFCSPHS